MGSCIKIMTGKWFVSCCCLRREYHNFDDLDVGLVGEYVDGKEDIASYIERVELYFAANYVKADYKVATFLAFIVADAYGVPRNLLAPDRQKNISLFCNSMKS